MPHASGTPSGATPSSSTPKTIVIKLGTSSILSSDTSHPKLSILSSLVETVVRLRSRGHRVVLVCSGAIGMGRLRMNIRERPKTLGERQALAALGQLRLVALWDSLFAQVGVQIAQVLLTRNDIADRPRYLNARTTLSTLLSAPFDAVPIVNENDTVSVSELRFGDNDTLSAITAGLVDADYLFLCTDVDGLYTGNPRSDPSARRLGVVRSVGEARSAVSVDTPGTNFGTGGMQTKLIAAELATAAGVATVIINGERPSNIVAVVEAGLPTAAGSSGPPRPTPSSALPRTASSSTSTAPGGGGATEDVPDSLDQLHSMASSLASLSAEEASTVGHPPLVDPPHTLFLPHASPLTKRKWSVLHALHPAGTVVIDEGAFRRISRPESGGRLLPAGVVAVEGTWERMQAVRIVVRRPRRSSAGDSSGVSTRSANATPATTTAPTATNSTATTSSGEGGRRPTTTVPPSLSTALHSGRSTPDLPSLGPSSSTMATPLSSQHQHLAPADGGSISSSSSSSGGGTVNGTAKPRGADETSAAHEWELVEVGRGLANYNSIDCDRIKGCRSSQIHDLIGHADSDYVSEQIALHASPYEPTLLTPSTHVATAHATSTATA